MKNNRGFSVVAGLLIILIIAVVGFAGWYVWQSNEDDVILNNYAECVAQDGALIQESYPEVCVYKDQRFTNPDQKAEIIENDTLDDKLDSLDIKELGISLPLDNWGYDFIKANPDDNTFDTSNVYSNKTKDLAENTSECAKYLANGEMVYSTVFIYSRDTKPIEGQNHPLEFDIIKKFNDTYYYYGFSKNESQCLRDDGEISMEINKSIQKDVEDFEEAWNSVKTIQ